MTEGVQQPFEITITSATYENWIELNAAVFPNPTANFVELRILGDYQSLNYELIDIGGKVITKKEIASMKNGVILVNAARGGVIDENDWFLVKTQLVTNKDRLTMNYEKVGLVGCRNLVYICRCSPQECIF